MAQDFASKAWPLIDRLLLSELASGCRVLDLCCGSGQIARLLSEHGLRVTGIDLSPAMLRLASNNCPESHFFVADARRFSLAKHQHAALSAFNSLAHIPSAQDLRAVFANVRGILVPSGMFLFDLTMEEGYRRLWRGSFELAAGGHTCTVFPRYDPRSRIAHNFVVCRPGLDVAASRKQPICFTILQKCYPRNEVSSWLRNAGFRVVRSFDATRDLGMEDEFGRCFFLATA